jgi:oligopeptide transport system ATP-binding protein
VSEPLPQVRDPLLKVRDLVKHYPQYEQRILSKRQVGAVRAVDGINLDVMAGETVGIVGESGCGKSTTARLILRLIEATSGSITFDGVDVGKADTEALRKLRREIQIVFQDPYASLNPRLSVREIVGEGLRIWGETDDFDKKVGDLLDQVGLNRRFLDRYPHEFSGGQRQRLGIARALAVRPRMLILDEPVSALDVSVQAQVLNLLVDLRAEFDLTMVFIAHDLSVVRQVCDRVAVMYLGRIVEIGDREAIYTRSTHPYTQALMSAVPVPDPVHERERERIPLEGDPPSPLNPPSGCRFNPRCFKAQEICRSDDPLLIERVGAHECACHFPEVTNVT